MAPEWKQSVLEWHWRAAGVAYGWVERGSDLVSSRTTFPASPSFDRASEWRWGMVMWMGENNEAAVDGGEGKEAETGSTFPWQNCRRALEGEGGQVTVYTGLS